MSALPAFAPARDRWLPLLRAVALLVLVLTVGITLFNIPYDLARNQSVCTGDSAACPGNSLTAADIAQLRQAGLSLGFLAIYPVALTTFSMLVFALVASLIFWRRSHDWFGIFAAITLAGAGFTLTIGQPPPTIVAYYPALLYPVQLLDFIGSVCLSTFFFLFPDGHFVPPWTGWLVPLVIVHEAFSTFRPDLLGKTDWIGLGVPLTVLFAIIYRYWRVSNTRQRQQTKWVAYSSIVVIIGIISIISFSTLVPPSSLPLIVSYLIFNGAWYLFVILIPVSIGIAILRSRLWDIDLLIRRTLVYGVLTAMLALVYLGAVVALEAVFTKLTGQGRSELVTVVSTLAIAALFVPLRNRTQAVIDRRLYRRKYDAARTLAQFGTSLRDEVNLNELSSRLLTAVNETMQPESVALWLVKR
ncbi:MAG: hypothetical protein ABI847_06405 [Anaerolineales bacterium]